jgi:signal transduction histidine kinase
MSVFGSLTNRIFLASALLAMLTIGLAIYLISVRLTRDAEGELERNLVESGRLLEQQHAVLAGQFLLAARLVADLPKLKAALDPQDAATVAPIAGDYQRQVGADLMLVTDRRGARLVGPASLSRPLDLPTVREGLAGRESAAFWSSPDGLMQVFTVPVSIDLQVPDLLGTLTVGFRLDDRRAEQFKRATGSDIAYVLDGRAVAATLPTAVRGQLASRAPDAGVTRTHLGTEDYLIARVPLVLPLHGPSGPEPVALVLRSRSSQLRSLRTVNTALLAAAALAIALATLLSYGVSRSITRPIATVTAAMREMATTGDLTRKIALREPARWQDEDARLLATTFNTLTDSIVRFQREAASRERLLALGRLSTVIAHEVRNPLMIIKAALRSLGPAAPEAEQRDAAADIDEQVGRLDRIVHDVLDFARPVTFELAPTDVARICREAAAAVQAGEPEGPAVTVRAAPLPLVTDGDRLRSALINLLANARHAVAARRRAEDRNGGVAIASSEDILLTASTHADGRMRISVVDRGTGIAPEHVPHVFEPYFTTKRAGTGIGLPIARNIIEGLGGTVTVRSEPGGTTIDIDLPVDAPGAAATAEHV